MDINQGLRNGSFLRNGTYQIVKMLGQGGFGITYLALDTTLERYVAIKEFFPSGYCDRDANTSHLTTVITNASDLVDRLKQKFLKEAKNIAKFDHPGIIKIFGAFEENNTAYYVMEYIEGGSLDDYVKSNGKMTEHDAVEVIKRVGNSIEYIHSKKFNHLDIKPANVMVRASNGQPILIDFGVSKQYDGGGHQTSTTPVGLSHGYSPLEQYEVGGISQFSPQTDLYSLAATLFFLLTGTNPPEAAKLINNPLEFPQGFNPEIASSITRAMSVARAHRQPDVPHFIAELVRATSVTSPFTEQATYSQPDVSGPTLPPPISTGPTVNSNSQEPRIIIQSSQKNNGGDWKSIMWMAIAGVIFIVIAVVIFSLTHSGNDAEIVATDSPEVVEVEIVEEEWYAPGLGKSIYSGEFNVDEYQNNIPDGEGYFEVIEGDNKGCKYKGHFKNGIMEGEGLYTYADGSTFKGIFKSNKFYDGRYTDKENGEYFVGKFKDGEPYDGTWYNSKHEILSTLKNGQ